MTLPTYARPLRVGVSVAFTLCTPSPRTTCIDSARLLKTTTSIVAPVSVLSLIFSMSMARDYPLPGRAGRENARSCHTRPMPLAMTTTMPSAEIASGNWSKIT